MQDRGQDPWIASKLEQLLSDRTFEDIHQETRTIEFGKNIEMQSIDREAIIILKG